MIETERIRAIVEKEGIRGNEALLASMVPDLVCEIEVLRVKLAEAEYEAEAAHQ